MGINVDTIIPKCTNQIRIKKTRTKETILGLRIKFRGSGSRAKESGRSMERLRHGGGQSNNTRMDLPTTNGTPQSRSMGETDQVSEETYQQRTRQTTSRT